MFTQLQATRNDSRRANTRREIVAAVSDLLDQGQAFSEISVSRIAQHAGLSRATFYLHFNDKRDLLGDLASQELSQWRAIADPLFENTSAGREEIESTLRALMNLWDQHRGVLGALIAMAEHDEAARTAWRAAIGAVADSIAEYSRGRSDVDVPDPEMGGLAITWMAERVCHQVLAGATPDERERLLQSVTELIWRSRKPND